MTALVTAPPARWPAMEGEQGCACAAPCVARPMLAAGRAVAVQSASAPVRGAWLRCGAPKWPQAPPLPCATPRPALQQRLAKHPSLPPLAAGAHPWPPLRLSAAGPARRMTPLQGRVCRPPHGCKAAPPPPRCPAPPAGQRQEACSSGWAGGAGTGHAVHAGSCGLDERAGGGRSTRGGCCCCCCCCGGRAGAHLECHTARLFLHSRVGEGPPDQALDRVVGVPWVEGGLALGLLAHQGGTVRQEGHDRGRDGVAVGVGDAARLARLDARHGRVGGAQVNADHGVGAGGGAACPACPVAACGAGAGAAGAHPRLAGVALVRRGPPALFSTRTSALRRMHGHEGGCLLRASWSGDYPLSRYQ